MDVPPHLHRIRRRTGPDRFSAIQSRFDEADHIARNVSDAIVLGRVDASHAHLAKGHRVALRNDAPDNEWNRHPPLSHDAQGIANEIKMGSRQNGQSYDMSPGLLGLTNDVGRRKPYPFIDNIHPHRAGSGGDLFSSVGMSVKTRFTNDVGEPPPEPGRNTIDIGANLFEIVFPACRNGKRNSRGSSILAEHLAQAGAPLAGRDACLRRLD